MTLWVNEDRTVLVREYETDTERVVVDVQRFKEAVWAVERENFRPGNALDALEQAVVKDGTMEVALREGPAAIWGPPIKVEVER